MAPVFLSLAQVFVSLAQVWADSGQTLPDLGKNLQVTQAAQWRKARVSRQGNAGPMRELEKQWGEGQAVGKPIKCDPNKSMQIINSPGSF